MGHGLTGYWTWVESKAATSGKIRHQSSGVTENRLEGREYKASFPDGTAVRGSNGWFRKVVGSPVHKVLVHRTGLQQYAAVLAIVLYQLNTRENHLEEGTSRKCLHKMGL